MMGIKKVTGMTRVSRLLLFAGVFAFVPVANLAAAEQTVLQRAKDLYTHTDYAAAYKLLQKSPDQSGPVLLMTGECLFMMGEFKKAGDVFEKAVALEPSNSAYYHWLGRAYGRRAETGNPFIAPAYASKARQNFERAVVLDPKNQEALNDLFDYYLQAPGFLGGGLNKASEVAQRIAQLDAAEGHYAMAQLADQKKQFDAAEEQLRRALELAPRQVGRVLDLAKYLSKRGRVQESEAAFEQAAKMAPNSPKVLFERAHTYVKEKRNLAQARELLQKYLKAKLTPDDPPRSQAEELLRQAGA